MKNYLGNLFTFYLGNSQLTGGNNPFYLYQVTTPGLSEDCEPTVTLKKVGEYTFSTIPSAERDGNMKSADLLRYLQGNRKGDNRKVKNFRDQLQDLISFNNEKSQILEESDPNEFPLWEMDSNLTRNILVILRDAMRWRFYSLQPGKFVDILTGNQEFTVFQINGTPSDMYLEPVKTYSTNDPGMTDQKAPKEKLYYPKAHFGNASELNKAIRQLEWRVLG